MRKIERRAGLRQFLYSERKMSHSKCFHVLSVFALFITLGNLSASAQEVKKIFAIAMENHNWTQPANQFGPGIQQIYNNPNAPFINSLVKGTSSANVNA